MAVMLRSVFMGGRGCRPQGRHRHVGPLADDHRAVGQSICAACDERTAVSNVKRDTVMKRPPTLWRRPDQRMKQARRVIHAGMCFVHLPARCGRVSSRSLFMPPSKFMADLLFAAHDARSLARRPISSKGQLSSGLTGH